jgi:hypothetical protein
MPKLLDAPFWLDPSDPHRMRSATAFNPAGVCNHLLFRAIGGTAKLIRRRFGKAAYRVAAAGISSEQAVDEAIACIKQILNK